MRIKTFHFFLKLTEQKTGQFPAQTKILFMHVNRPNPPSKFLRIEVCFTDQSASSIYVTKVTTIDHLCRIIATESLSCWLQFLCLEEFQARTSVIPSSRDCKST